jgi:preprotein translocase subunit SecY
MKTPAIWVLIAFRLYSKIPIIRVKTGLNEFNIPVRELLIFVCAIGNRKAGMALPISPIIITDNIFFLLSSGILRMAMGNRQRVAINILNEPIWNDEKESNPFFINM